MILGGSSNGFVRLIQCLVMGAKMPATKPANNQMPIAIPNGRSSSEGAAGDDDEDDENDAV